MAIDIDLEKNGYKKKGFLGFSYTTYFFYSIVPIFRIDVKGFLIVSAVWLLTQGPLYILQYLPIDLENNTKIINFLKSLLDMRIKKLLIIFYIFAISIYSIFSCIWILIGNWYNKHYTKRLLQDGYLPKENDEYSIALLKEYGYLEYTEKEKENIEKMKLYKDIVKSAKKDEKIKLSFFITYLLIFPIVITLLFYILINYAPDITVIEFLEKFDVDTNFQGGF
jgi:hypothetical protein